MATKPCSPRVMKDPDGGSVRGAIVRLDQEGSRISAPRDPRVDAQVARVAQSGRGRSPTTSARSRRRSATFWRSIKVTGNWDRWSGGNVGLDRARMRLHLFIDNDGAFFETRFLEADEDGPRSSSMASISLLAFVRARPSARSTCRARFRRREGRRAAPLGSCRAANRGAKEEGARGRRHEDREPRGGERSGVRLTLRGLQRAASLTLATTSAARTLAPLHPRLQRQEYGEERVRRARRSGRRRGRSPARKSPMRAR